MNADVRFEACGLFGPMLSSDPDNALDSVQLDRDDAGALDALDFCPGTLTGSLDVNEAGYPTRFDRPYPRELRGYALFQFALAVAVTIALPLLGEGYGLETRLAGIALVVWGLLNLGGLFEGRSWSFHSEALRVLVAPALPLAVLSGGLAWGAAAVLALGVPIFALRLLGLRTSFAPTTQ